MKCNNADCKLRASCESYYDPDRKENEYIIPDQVLLHSFDSDRDDCFVIRTRLQGTPEVQREWAKTTKRARRAGGYWQ